MHVNGGVPRRSRLLRELRDRETIGEATRLLSRLPRALDCATDCLVARGRVAAVGRHEAVGEAPGVHEVREMLSALVEGHDVVLWRLLRNEAHRRSSRHLVDVELELQVGRGGHARGGGLDMYGSDAVQHAEGREPVEQMGAVDLGERRLLLVLGALATWERADVGGESRLLLGRAVVVLEEHAVGHGRISVHREAEEEQEFASEDDLRGVRCRCGRAGTLREAACVEGAARRWAAAALAGGGRGKEGPPGSRLICVDGRHCSALLACSPSRRSAHVCRASNLQGEGPNLRGERRGRATGQQR